MPRVVRDRKEAELIIQVQHGIQTLAMIEEKLETIFAHRNVLSKTLEVVEAYDKDQALTSIPPLVNKTAMILILERQCLFLLDKHSEVRKRIKISSQEMEKYAFLNERLALELNFFVRSLAEDKMCMSIIEKRISQTVQQFVQSVDTSYESEEAAGGSRRGRAGEEERIGGNQEEADDTRRQEGVWMPSGRLSARRLIGGSRGSAGSERELRREVRVVKAGSETDRRREQLEPKRVARGQQRSRETRRRV
eukprot:766653-Hanusia_phi.AAC.7